MNQYKKYQKMKRQLSVASLKDSNNFSDQAQYIRSHFSTKRQRRIARTLVALGAVGTIAHETSTTLSPLLIKNKHKTQNEVIVNLDTKKQLGLDTLYKTDDKETNVIMDLMSGYADKNDFNAILKEYGYDSIVPINKVSHQDPALYKTLRTMHQKYGNPYVTIGAAFENPLTGKKDPERASFNGLHNRVNIYNIKDQKINFNDPTSKYFQEVFNSEGDTIPKSKKEEDRQRYLINNWIAELAHAIQLQRDGAIAMGIDVLIDETEQFYMHDKLYDIPGTFEYKAHSIIEPKLAQEFIEHYIQNSNTDDPATQYQIGIFYSGYFDNFHDSQKAEERLLRSAKSNHGKTNKYSCFLLGNRYLKAFEESLSILYGYNSCDNSTKALVKEKAPQDFKAAIQYYGKSARAGSTEAYFKIIRTYRHYGYDRAINHDTTTSGETNGFKEGISRALELWGKRPELQKIDSTTASTTNSELLIKLYLADLYLKNNQPKEARERYQQTLQQPQKQQEDGVINILDQNVHGHLH